MSVPSSEEFELVKIKVLADFVFGRGAGEALLSGGKMKLEYSSSTGRVRHVYVNGKRILTIRPSDGMITLSLEGAKRLLRIFPPPKLRVIVSDEAAPFVSKGLSVFAKHVIMADPEIRPGAEVIIVDRHDNLLAVGRAALSGEEMLMFNNGVAVKVRRGIYREKNKS